MNHNLLTIYSQNCWIDQKLQAATVFVKDNLIDKIENGKVISSNENFVDAGENILMPGVIDAHVHINEPGRTDWEGFETATQATAAGGTTTLVDMPLNATPVTTSKENFDLKLKAAFGKLNVNCGFYGGIVPDNIDRLEDLIQSGVLGIKAFLTHSGIDDFPNVTEADLEKGMAILSKYDLPLLVHCELESNNFEAQNILNQNPSSYKAYLASRPKSWENNAIRLMIKLCRKYNCKVHIVHLSSAEALNDIIDAKKEGLPITVETCPHYLLFNAEEIADGDTRFKCAPPIRERSNNNLLKEAIASGVIDFLTTDHSPAPPEIKELKSGNFRKAWGGIAGLQFLLPASWTALKETISLESFIPLLTEKPALFLNLNHQKGFLKVGYDADFVIWNPNEKFNVSEDTIFHRHKITPYLNQNLFGKVIQTYVNGKRVFDKNQFNAKNAGNKILNQ
jgi:allantoinase